MKHRILKRICILLSMALLLTACGESAEQSGIASSVSEDAAVSAVQDEREEVTAAPAVQEETGAASGSMVQEGTEIVPASEGEIIIADLRGDSFLSERVASFARENPSYGMQYQAADQEEESDRILLETANGEGPDILFLTRRDMESLQANGVLGDLGQLISQDTMEVLLPGVIQMGTYEEKMVAIPLSVAVRTLLTSRNYWQEDTWTAEDILSVLEEHSELRGLFVDMTGQDDFFIICII